MANVLQELYRQRQRELTDAYAYFGVVKTSRAGFFTPFESVDDLREQVRASVVVSVVGMEKTFNSAAQAVRGAAFLALKYAFFDFGNSGDNLSKVIAPLVGTIFLAISMMINTLWQLAALLARSVSSGIAAINGRYSASKPGNDASEPRRRNEEPVLVVGARMGAAASATTAAAARAVPSSSSPTAADEDLYCSPGSRS